LFPKILVVEDDKSISDLISLHLKKNNFEYLVVHNGEDALSHLDNFMPDFVILDWMIPGLSGLEVLRRIRNKQEYKILPILMLTAKNSEQDKIISFESGLDDYITKPFLPSELIARVKAILKRTNQLNQDHESLIFDDIKIDTSQKKAFRGTRRLNLGPTEFKILLFLLKNKQKVFSREQILNKIWPNQVNVEIRTG
jgi:two-component system phosphate regulon response regulator PhoB